MHPKPQDLVALLVVLLLLAACQPVPHPFADLRDASGPALAPPDSSGVVVVPVAGAPAAAADALAAALRERDVPASTESGNRKSFRLEAEAEPSRGSMRLAWTLRTASGRLLGNGTAAAMQSDPKIWASLANGAAAPIVGLIAGNPAAEAASGTALVMLRGITGAPGDGGTALSRAIGVALDRQGVDFGTDARFALSCIVAVAPPKDGRQQVSVRWLLALPAGRRLGEVSQQNSVPAGSLDRAWGDVAYDVAGAAAPGIARLIARAEQ
ncbi:MAG: hypothetical protein ACREFQ_00815 [Stellaceae bacterium]